VDTTEITCQGHINRLQSKKGLGLLSDHATLGYFLQPILCLDAITKSPLGIAGVHIWKHNHKLVGDHKKRYITDRESNKWYSPVKEARDSILSTSTHVTFVMDREGDIYEVLEAIPTERADLVVRSNHDRTILHADHRMAISTFLGTQPIKGRIAFKLQSHKHCKQRVLADIRYGNVIIPKAKNGLFLPCTRDRINMSVVDVKERSRKLGKIHWRLWTSKPIHSLEEAVEIIDIYKSRWHVEELFRLMKTESFDIESSELEKPANLFKLGVLVMEASLLIKQLKAAREKESEIKVESVFTQSQIECLRALDIEYKGTTEKQSNPFSQNSLSWASWIIARIGGWKGYASQRPPGSITYKRGLERFYDFYEGFHIARLMYKR
jgi:hypothetical protein